jgi:hypothetical protein
MGMMRNTCTKCWSENVKGTDNLVDIDVDGKIILEWMSEKWDGKIWTKFIWLHRDTSGGFCEDGNEPSVFI